MVTYYEPSATEYKEGKEALDLALEVHPGQQYQIGRVAEPDADKLPYRDKYKNATEVFGLWLGAKGKVAVFEREMILYCKDRAPELCRNQQYGGGPQSDHPTHLVYVVFW